MKIILPYESFPWEEDSLKYNITTTKQQLIKKTYNNIYEYYINSLDIGYGFGSISKETILDSHNIIYYKNLILKHIYIFVNDETSLFENFLQSYYLTQGIISIKLKSLDHYNYDILYSELSKIKEFVSIAKEEHQIILINEFNNYLLDIDDILIDEHFNLLLNSYYYDKNIIENIFYNENKIIKKTFNKEFLKKNELFNNFKEDKNSIQQYIVDNIYKKVI